MSLIVDRKVMFMLNVLGRLRGTAVSALLLVITLAQANAAEWLPQRICEAAVYSYFFTETMPEYKGEYLRRYRYVSDAGYSFECTPSSGVAYFMWKNQQDEDMSSNTTRYFLEGDILKVRTHYGDTTFQLKDGRISKISQH